MAVLWSHPMKTIYLSIYLHFYLFIYQSLYLFIYLTIYLFMYLFTFLFISIFTYVSVSILSQWFNNIWLFCYHTLRKLSICLFCGHSLRNPSIWLFCGHTLRKLFVIKHYWKQFSYLSLNEKVEDLFVYKSIKVIWLLF